MARADTELQTHVESTEDGASAGERGGSKSDRDGDRETTESDAQTADSGAARAPQAETVGKAVRQPTKKPRTWREKLARTRQYLRLQPFDTSTEDGRSDERFRRATLTTTSGFASRGLTALVSTVSIPLTIGYLGQERYGMWAAINALLAWAVLADFGLGWGLLNHLSEAYGKNDRDAAARFVSTAFFALTAIALVFAVVLLPLVLILPWERILNLHDPALIAEAPQTVAAVIIVFLFRFPLGIVGQIYSAHQRGYIANVFSVLGAILSITTLVIVIKLEGGLPWLIFATGGVGLVMVFFNLFYIGADMPWLLPRWSRRTKGALRALVQLSVPLFLFQIGALLINEAQILIIAHVRDVGEVTRYSVFLKVFTIPVYIVAMIDGPLVPAFRESYARGDKAWLRSTFWNVQKLKLWIALASTAMFLLFGNLFTRLLSRNTVEFDRSVWLAAGLLLAVGCWNGGFTHLFTAVDRIWVLVATVVANGLITAPLTYFLAGAHGMLGVVLATAAFSVVITAWLMPLLMRYLIKDMRPVPAVA
jgi:O-antigen/teichoic acid export membrane protein